MSGVRCVENYKLIVSAMMSDMEVNEHIDHLDKDVLTERTNDWVEGYNAGLERAKDIVKENIEIADSFSGDGFVSKEMQSFGLVCLADTLSAIEKEKLQVEYDI